MRRGAASVGVAESGSTAVLVTIAGVELLDRRSVELVDPGMPTHPYHHEGAWAVGRYLGTPGARPMPLADAIALVERVDACAARRARESLEALAAAVAVPIARIALRACPALPETIEARIRDARAQTIADSAMYRHALARAAEARGWSVRWYERDRVRDEAAAAIDGDLDAVLAAIGRSIGPPWKAQHKLAAMAALAR